MGMLRSSEGKATEFMREPFCGLGALYDFPLEDKVSFAQICYVMRVALILSLKKFSWRVQILHPVMCMVCIAAGFTTLWWILGLLKYHHEHNTLSIGVAMWLWFTIWASNFAEAISEVMACREVRLLSKIQSQTLVRKLNISEEILCYSGESYSINSDSQVSAEQEAPWKITNLSLDGLEKMCLRIPITQAKRRDFVLVKCNEVIPCNGTVVAGGVSRGDSKSKTQVQSLPKKVKIGEVVSAVFLVIRVESIPLVGCDGLNVDMMARLERKKTSNEMALSVFVLATAVIFVLVTATMLPFSHYAVESNKQGQAISYTTLMAFLVCLLPTTISGLLSSIGVAGMSRLMHDKIWARSIEVVETAGDVDVLMLDKTGTITVGNRHAVAFHPAKGVSLEEIAQVALLASLEDKTTEGKSIVNLSYMILYRTGNPGIKTLPEGAVFVPFNSQNKMSGVDYKGRWIRKGSHSAIVAELKRINSFKQESQIEILKLSDELSSRGATSLLLVDGRRILGVIELRDRVKAELKNRIAKIRAMGIKTVMVTGDNPLTAAAIAAEAGVDDFVAEADARVKLKTLKAYQARGHVVAMAGDGTNDVPALKQSDVALAMSSGSLDAQGAANMIDLDSNPSKLIDIVEMGKQMLITRGCLTTFSLANDVAKYFALIPSAFAFTVPSLERLNIMDLHSPHSALLASVIFNALIILFLLPIALMGVKCQSLNASQRLRRNLFFYGLGGVLMPFVSLKLIDMILVYFDMV